MNCLTSNQIPCWVSKAGDLKQGEAVCVSGSGKASPPKFSIFSLLQVEEAERESQGGVLLTAASKEQPTIGKAGFGTNRLICKPQTLPWVA